MTSSNTTSASPADLTPEVNTIAQSSAAPTGSPSSTFNASDTVGSLQELQAKAPEIYNAMMEGIAMTIVNDMNDQQARLKALMEQERRDSGQS